MFPGGRALTISERFEAASGRPSGFDYMRLSLAVSIVCVHSIVISYGPATDPPLWLSPVRPLLVLLVPMFFALSGFLVAGSLERSRTLVMFLGLRAIRIYPALCVEVLLSAFVIGALVTTDSPAQYFAAPAFRSYLLNVTGDVHYFLPGVFHANPAPDVVNRQLWTVPFELLCYVALSGLALAGVVRHRWLSVLAALGLALVYGLARLHRHGWVYTPTLAGLTGTLVVCCFLSGVALYLYRDRVACSPWLALGSAVLFVALMDYIPYGEYLSPFPIAYLTVFLGLATPRRFGFIAAADYSYGIYLYGFVIQQTVASLGAWTHHWWMNLLLSLPLTVLFAAFSWHVVEKRALRLRGPLIRLEAGYLRARGRLLGVLGRPVEEPAAAKRNSAPTL